MTAYLFWEFVILIAGVWLMATLFFIYGWLLLKRQKKMMLELLSLRDTQEEEKGESQPDQKAEPIQLEISKNEPIEKYKDVSPDEVNISFVEEEK